LARRKTAIFSSDSFDIGGDPEGSTTVDLWSDPVQGRIEYLDGAGIKRVARLLQPGTTLVVISLRALIPAQDRTLQLLRRIAG
jgi:hypothetical protein